MVSLPPHLVWGSLSILRTRLRKRVVWRLWVGVGSLGIQLARRIPDLWRRPVLLCEPDFLQPQQFLPIGRSLRRARESLQPPPGRGEDLSTKKARSPRVRPR